MKMKPILENTMLPSSVYLQIAADIDSGNIVGEKHIVTLFERNYAESLFRADIADIIENNLGIIREKQGREASAERIGEEIERLAVGIFGIFDNGYGAGTAHEYIIGIVCRDILIIVKLCFGKLAGFLVGAIYLCLFQRRCHNA